MTLSFTACLTSNILCFWFPCNGRFYEVSSTKVLRAFNFRCFIGVFSLKKAQIDQAILEDHEGTPLINRSPNTHLKQRELEKLTVTKYTENPPLVFSMFFKLCKWQQVEQSVRYNNDNNNLGANENTLHDVNFPNM